LDRISAQKYFIVAVKTSLDTWWELRGPRRTSVSGAFFCLGGPSARQEFGNFFDRSSAAALFSALKQ
jgi:hypothetical protein